MKVACPQRFEKSHETGFMTTDDIVNDHRSSFRVVQGNEGAHTDFLRMLSHYYQRTLTPDSLMGLREEVLRLFKDEIDLVIPFRHIQTTTYDSGEVLPINAATRKAQSVRYMGMLLDHVDDRIRRGPEDDNHWTRERTVVAYHTANTDLDYTKKVRPSAQEGDLPKSYFHDYIMGDRLTGSDSFDTIYASMDDALLVLGDRSLANLGKIAAWWEAPRINESYFPPRYAELGNLVSASLVTA